MEYSNCDLCDRVVDKGILIILDGICPICYREIEGVEEEEEINE